MLQFLKNSITDWLRAHGYHLSHAPPSVDALEGYLELLFERYRIDCVIDVGANTGQYARSLRQMGYDGFICSFEPVTDVYDELRSHCREDEAWSGFNLALGAKKETRPIRIANKNAMSSFRPTTTDFDNLFGGKVTYDQVEDVPVARLDDVIREIDVIDKHREEASEVHLKIDTEGFEREVMKGAPKMLVRCRSLQLEVAFTPMFEEQIRIAEAIDALGDLGFEVGGVFPITYDRELRVLAADLVMVKPS